MTGAASQRTVEAGGRTLSPRMEGRFDSLHNLIGNTPLIELRCRCDGATYTVYAKHEVMNFTGSIKDRMALHMVESAWRSGQLAEGDVLVEATSGNTGIALAAIGRALEHPVRIYMPDWMSRERVLLIRSLGAEIVPVSKAEGGFLGSIAMADEFARASESEAGAHPGGRRPRAFRPHQFSNVSNVEAHRRTTGPELLVQMRRAGVEPGAFVAGVGTGGTIMGVGRYLREVLPHVKLHPLEPANSPTLRTGHRVGQHRIQGISDEFVPSIVDLAWLDDIVDVWDGEAIHMARRLGAEVGLAVGISSGANLLGAVRAGQALGDGAVVATVFPDSNKKYLSTDLCKEEPVATDALSARIEIDSCRVLPRLPEAELPR